jgi:ceramide glucosyltransferase
MTGLLVSLVGLLVVLNLVSMVLTAIRCRPRLRAARPSPAPPVSIIRPLAGLENNLEQALGSSFDLDYPNYELLFCVDRDDDPAAAIARRLCRDHPHVEARLLVGEDRFSANPKLNNCQKGWDAARHELVVFADSNVFMPRDYVDQLLDPLAGRVVVTCSPPIGAAPIGLAAEVECAFLNSLQARALYAADMLGLNPVQGKSMMVRRSWLDERGGLRALSAKLAEDAALRGLVLAAGARARIVRAPFRQMIGRRSFRRVLDRQRRWAMLRRLASPSLYSLELLLGTVSIAVLAGLAARGAGLPPLAVAALTAACLYVAELALAWRLGWIASWRTPLAMVLRDILLPAVWLCGLLDRRYRWGRYVVETDWTGIRMGESGR